MASAAGTNRAAQRLFFALWPNAKLQAALHVAGQSLQKAFGGRAVQTENIHMTLAFLGSVPAEQIEQLHSIGGGIVANRFELKLTELGCWKRSAVAWIAPESVPGALESLVTGLRNRLLTAGFRVDDKPFAPHITLLRKAKCRPQADLRQPSLEWRIDRFVLMRSDTLPDGPQYSQLGIWPLS